MSVTRQQITHHIGCAFIGGGASRPDLIHLAEANRAPAEVLQVLSDLPERRFGRLYEVWEHLCELEAA